MNHVFNNTINLYYIHETNAGDIFAKFFVEKLINAKIIHTGPGNEIHKNVFQITGSIISDCTKESIILGTGIILKNRHIKDFKKCYIIRGKCTLEKIKECKPEFNTDQILLGDPGLLLSYFVENKDTEKKYKYGILLHYMDKSRMKQYFSDKCLFSPDVLIINILNSDLIDLANKILSCEKIITSSLHGIIFSHSMEIPVSWISLKTSLLPKDTIKYIDYLSIYNLDDNMCCNIDNILDKDDLKNLPTIDIDKEFLRTRKKELLNTIINVFREYNYNINSEFDILK